ncbi:peroxiredoxin [Lewinellaceae bacterium SD302]|nr:peroxiredoxin [Lewinellaceae bacterium SD302]
MKEHSYITDLRWTGNQGEGTLNYQVYARDHEISIQGGIHPIFGSSDPAFRGDPAKYNPEELLLASLSACHMLWYLHLCSVNGVNVVDYQDSATATMVEDETGSGRFTLATLQPKVVVSEENMVGQAQALHAEAGRKCFIANSVNFPVRHRSDCVYVESPDKH